jgi:hypothetical protein
MLYNCAFIVYFAFRLDSVFFSLFSQNIQAKCLYQLTFKFYSIVQSFFDYFPIVFILLFSI